MNKKLFIGLFAVLVASSSMAQTESGKGNLITKAKSFVERSVVHGLDTNYVKTPSRPWQISIKSRVSQTDLQMHSVIDGGELFDGEGTMPFIRGVGDMETVGHAEESKPPEGVGLHVAEEACDQADKKDDDEVEGDEVWRERREDAGVREVHVAALVADFDFPDFRARHQPPERVSEFMSPDVHFDCGRQEEEEYGADGVPSREGERFRREERH